MTSWQFYFIYLLPVLFYKSTVNGRGPRMLGEPCGEDDELMKCADGLECVLKGNGGKMRCRETATMEKEPKETLETDAILERCLHAKCTILFPDCPSDSVPVLSTGPISNDGTDPDGCCQPAIVQCKCDPQKCLVPSCPEATERRMTKKGTEIPGQCCDQFECRASAELNCENINCPDPKSTFFDLYSPDGQNCPNDSFRPDPYVPAGSCCPIVPQCQCRNGICEPARCNPDQKLVIESRGRGEPGKCCDQFKCLPKNGSNGGECHHEGRIYAVGELWRAGPCQECQCSATVALCRKMECPTLTSECQWIGFSPGECCPVCLGCRDEEGQTYTIGQNWERDGCTNCTCGTDFHWQCHKFICQTHCENPKPVPGECCPICDEPTIIHESAPICPELADCPLSSFEQGSEQTIFIRPSDNDYQQNQEEQKPTENLSFWLIFALTLPIVAFIIFTIGIAILVIKCKRENTKWMHSNNHEKRPLNWHLNLTNWRNAHMRPFVQEENGNKNNLTEKNASLLRPKELSNLL